MLGDEPPIEEEGHAAIHARDTLRILGRAAPAVGGKVKLATNTLKWHAEGPVRVAHIVRGRDEVSELESAPDKQIIVQVQKVIRQTADAVQH